MLKSDDMERCRSASSDAAEGPRDEEGWRGVGEGVSGGLDGVTERPSDGVGRGCDGVRG